MIPIPIEVRAVADFEHRRNGELVTDPPITPATALVDAEEGE